MSNLPETFYAGLAREARAFVPLWQSRVQSLVQSPIEAEFAIAFAMISLLRNDPAAIVSRDVADTLGRNWFIRPQVPILHYVADFVVGPSPSDTARNIIVECDGHDFHERTKAQAEKDRKRDRRMQAHGTKVFRFTGSEIHRDAFRCAGEVWTELLRSGGAK